ncbi:hypothetical protein FOL47_008367 [Perkinsus chesapeaki]|uniref:Tyrosine-protein kinase ephrin type A/B receptor-like domain-containing protein n=1 Tax=Perkinsus chesapeaki TaxID=330153 RepID=A0A7J6LEM0_PERCH|nr:hypothetical protein FOL47_008367 [Perkinsus chesapeaki]
MLLWVLLPIIALVPVKGGEQRLCEDHQLLYTVLDTCHTLSSSYTDVAIFAERKPDMNNSCELPAPLHEGSCSAQCDKGHFYTGRIANRHIQGQCSKCSNGRYSLGGGNVINSWEPERSHLSLKSWCVYSLEFGFGWAIGETVVPYRTNATATGNNSSSDNKCMSWVAGENGDVIHSGENYGKSDMDSVLRLQDNWLRDGEVRFVYMVDGEDQFDGFRLIIDGTIKLGPEYMTVDDDGKLIWKEATGPHTLEWVYSKDMSDDYGYDRAWLRSIELIGTRAVDVGCLPCPTGDQGSLTTTVREQCLSCGRDQYPDHNTSMCQPCPSGQKAFAFGNSAPAEPHYKLIISCPAELGKIATTIGCTSCPAGQVPLIELTVDSFPEPSTLPFRFKGGSWQTRQSSLATEITEHLTRSVELVWRVEMLARGVLKVNYSIQARGDAAAGIVVFLGARAGQEAIRLTPAQAAKGVSIPPKDVMEISIRCEGAVGTKFIFHSFTLTSSRGGGARKCQTCASGQALKDGLCQDCPKGQYSSAEGAPCKPCAANTYTSTEGSASCLPCSSGMTSVTGSDSCYLTTGSDLIIGDAVFDMKALNDKVWGESGPLGLPDGRAAYVNPIAGRAEITKAVVADKCSAAASEDITDRVVIGKSVDSVQASSHGLTLLLTAPAEVGACRNEAMVSLVCDPRMVNASTYPVATLVPTAQDSRVCGGQYVSIEWHLAEACRVCSSSDYVRTVGECVNGSQEVSYVVSDSLCMVRGGPPAGPETQSCDGRLPWQDRYFIIAITVGCLALLSSLLYVLYLQRRWNETYGAYMKLKEHVGPQTVAGMGTEPLELGRSVITFTMEEGPDPYPGLAQR